MSSSELQQEVVAPKMAIIMPPPRRKRTRIENIHSKRQLAMRSINQHLAEYSSFFNIISKRSLNKYRSVARSLDYRLWYLAQTKPIEAFLMKNLEEDYTEVPEILIDQLVTYLAKHIRLRNAIYFSTKENPDNNYNETLNNVLIKGNITQDFLFGLLDEQEALPIEIVKQLKEAIRLLIRSIAVLQYCFISNATHPRDLFELQSDEETVVGKDAKRKIENLVDNFKASELLDLAFKLIKDKLAHGSVRSSFMAWAYEYLCSVDSIVVPKDKDEFLLKDLPLIIEVSMGIMYYDNQILDKKGGVEDIDKVKRNLLARTILKDWCFEVIEKNLKDHSDQIEVARLLRRIFISVDIGQYVDKTLNNFKTYDDSAFTYQGLNEDLLHDLWDSHNEHNREQSKRLICQCLNYLKNNPVLESLKELVLKTGVDEQHLKLYLDRIFLACSVLFVDGTEMIAKLIRSEGESKDKLMGMIAGYSLSLQIINDCADFIAIPKWSSCLGSKTVEKKSSDVFKDLENRTISLPILIHLGKKGKNSIVYRLLKSDKQKLSRIEKYLVLKEFHREKTLVTCEKISQDMARKVKSQYKIVRTNAASLFIRDLWSICFVNRFQKERTYKDAGFRLMTWLGKLFRIIKRNIQIEFSLFNAFQLGSAIRRKLGFNTWK